MKKAGNSLKKSLCQAMVLGLIFFGAEISYAQLNFTVTSSTGAYSITCANPTLVLTATSNYTASPVTFTWISAQSGTVANANLPVTAQGSYTVIASTGTLSSAAQVIAIGINTAAPTVTITPPSLLTCTNWTTSLEGTSSASNVIFMWFGTSIVMPLCLTPTCITSITGTYSLIVKDLTNGCITATATTVSENRIYPSFGTIGIYTVACPNGTVNLAPSILSAFNMNYVWSSPPEAMTSGSNTRTLTTNAPGNYTIIATNTVNGCSTQTEVSVYACVGIKENYENNSGIFVYPNPMREKLTISAPDKAKIYSLKITNLIGQTVFEKAEMASPCEIDSNGFDKGLYCVLIYTSRGYGSFKVYKE